MNQGAITVHGGPNHVHVVGHQDLHELILLKVSALVVIKNVKDEIDTLVLRAVRKVEQPKHKLLDVDATRAVAVEEVEELIKVLRTGSLRCCASLPGIGTDSPSKSR